MTGEQDLVIFFPKKRCARGVIRLRAVLHVGLMASGLPAPIVLHQDHTFHMDPRVFILADGVLVYEADMRVRAAMLSWYTEHPEWTSNQIVDPHAMSTDDMTVVLRMQRFLKSTRRFAARASWN